MSKTRPPTTMMRRLCILELWAFYDATGGDDNIDTIGPDVSDHSGVRPLHTATKIGNDSALEALLEVKPSLLDMTVVSDSAAAAQDVFAPSFTEGWSALHFAMHSGHFSTVWTFDW